MLAALACLAAAGCSTAAARPSAGGAGGCATPQPVPSGLAVVPAAVTLAESFKSDCVTVDGHLVANAEIALAISNGYDNLQALARASMPTSPAAIPAMTSPAWLKFGVARAVSEALLADAVQKTGVSVSPGQLSAAVANCRAASKMVHRSSTCSQRLFRDSILGKEVGDWFQAHRLSYATWFGQDLRRHHIVISGYPVRPNDLSSYLDPPGCALVQLCHSSRR